MAAIILYFLNNGVKVTSRTLNGQSYFWEMASRAMTNTFGTKLGHKHVLNSKWPPKCPPK